MANIKHHLLRGKIWICLFSLSFDMRKNIFKNELYIVNLTLIMIVLSLKNVFCEFGPSRLRGRKKTRFYFPLFCLKRKQGMACLCKKKCFRLCLNGIRSINKIVCFGCLDSPLYLRTI